MSTIVISTGPLNFAYEIIDTIFVIDGSSEGLFSGINPNKAFEGVKQKLREQCHALGGDAVVFCQFEYRNASTGGAYINKQTLEIFAYGTVVKRK